MEFGDLHVGETYFIKAGFEGLLYVVFAVDDEDRLYFSGILAGEKFDEVFIIAMGAHAADAADFRMDFVKDAEDMYFFCACHKTAAEGVGFTVTDEQDGIAAVLDVIADMMFDATGIGHAAGGDDDAGLIPIVE